MKILITSDLHFSASPRDAYRFVFLQETLPQMIGDHQSALVLILGDLTEATDYHSAQLVNTIVDGLCECAMQCNLDIIPGNHDATDTALPFFRFLGHIPTINWIGTPHFSQSSGRRILYLPHTHRPWAEPLPRADYVFAHNTFDGAVSGSHALKGLSIDLLAPTKALMIISGDVHTPQTTKGAIEVTYVGAPYTVDFGDDYEPRVLLLDTATDTIMSIPVPGPQKRLIKVSTLAQLKKAHVNKGDVVKVEVGLPPEEAPHWNEYVVAIRNWGDDKEVVINSVTPIIDAVAGRLSRPKSVVPTDDKELIKHYAKARSLPKDVENRGLEFIDEH